MLRIRTDPAGFSNLGLAEGSNVGLGPRFQGLSFGVQGLGFEFLGFRIWAVGFGV